MTIAKILEELKAAEAECARLKQQMMKDGIGELLKNKEEKKGISYFGAVVPAESMDELRQAADLIRAKLPDSAFILGAEHNGKVNLVGMASESAVHAGVHMGKVVSAAAKICGGGGGGKPGMAQAGGKNPEKLSEAVSAGARTIAEMIQ